MDIFELFQCMAVVEGHTLVRDAGYLNMSRSPATAFIFTPHLLYSSARARSNLLVL